MPARRPGEPAGRPGDGRHRRHAGAAAARPGVRPDDLLRPGPRARAAVVRRRDGVRPLPGALDMSPRGILVAALLVMRDAYDRLHFTAPATTIAPLAIAAAVVLEESLSAAGIKALLVALVLLATNPVLTHATARAARVRALGEWTVQEGEQVQGERP